MNEMIMASHSLNNNTRMSLVISLCLNTNRLVSLIPPIASNLRYLISCGTIDNTIFPCNLSCIACEQAFSDNGKEEHQHKNITYGLFTGLLHVGFSNFNLQ